MLLAASRTAWAQNAPPPTAADAARSGDDIVVVGSRGEGRSSFESLVPVQTLSRQQI
jgi:hypothetical protein